jgi:hypothetical protein
VAVLVPVNGGIAGSGRERTGCSGTSRRGPLPGGHFLAEEAADELVGSLRAFLAG